jgi:hypothetical protein
MIGSRSSRRTSLAVRRTIISRRSRRLQPPPSVTGLIDSLLFDLLFALGSSHTEIDPPPASGTLVTYTQGMEMTVIPEKSTKGAWKPRSAAPSYTNHRVWDRGVKAGLACRWLHPFAFHLIGRAGMVRGGEGSRKTGTTGTTHYFRWGATAGDGWSYEVSDASVRNRRSSKDGPPPPERELGRGRGRALERRLAAMAGPTPDHQ